MPAQQTSAARRTTASTMLDTGVPDRERDAVLDLARAVAQLADEPLPTADVIADYHAARRMLADAWARSIDAMSDVANRPGSSGRASEIVDLLRRIKELDDSLQRQEVANRDGMFHRVREALAALADIDTTAALIARTPSIVCALGFDRAILSRITDATWLPENVTVERDPSWASEILAAGRAAPVLLTPTLPETEILRRRISLVVDNVQQRASVNKAIADASLSRSYAASPITTNGQVVGLLHGDCYYQQRELDETDRQVLATFAEGLGQVLARTLVLDQISAVRHGLDDIAGRLGAPQLGAAWNPAPPPGPRPNPTIAPLSGPAGPAGRAELTRREHEVLRHMAAGDTNARTARRLVISEGTVKSHVKHILRKLGAANRAEAVSIWFQMENEGRPRRPTTA